MKIASVVSLVISLTIPVIALAQETKSRTEHRGRIQKQIDVDFDSLLTLYKQIHAYPELAFEEEQTSARLAKELRQAGFTVTEKVGVTGVVGVLKNGVGPTILVRADMDSLPIIEQTGVPYASKVRTRDKDGLDVGIMHACGHDMNVTCLVGTARVMAQMKDKWKGTLVFIGQPAEEIGAGAKAMLEAGLLQKFPRPDFALALHCDGRYPTGHVNYREGQMQANVDSVDILVKGKGGHGAAPHATIDPIVIAARIILDLQTIVSRERNPLEPAVVTVGSIHGGTKHNIIPDDVKMQLTVRTMNDKARAEVLESIARIAKAAAMAARAPEPIVKLRDESFTPALINEADLTKKLVAVFKEVIGSERVHERPMSMGGEDFSQFTRAGLRTFYWHLGTADPLAFAESKKGGKALANTHSPYYAPVPEPPLRTGVLTMRLAILELLKEPRRFWLQLLRVRQILQALQAEDLEKSLRRAVKDRPAERIIAPRDLHDPLLHQETQGLAAMDAADCLDVGTHDRLAIGDDGKRFARGRRQAQLLLAPFQTRQPTVILRARHQLKTAGARRRHPIFPSPVPACATAMAHRRSTGPLPEEPVPVRGQVDRRSRLARQDRRVAGEWAAVRYCAACEPIAGQTACVVSSRGTSQSPE